jgi:hypothetical protein
MTIASLWEKLKYQDVSKLTAIASLLEHTRRDGAGNAPKSAGEDQPSFFSFPAPRDRSRIGDKT